MQPSSPAADQGRIRSGLDLGRGSGYAGDIGNDTDEIRSYAHMFFI
jgi:hypothetical protein